MNGEWWEPSVGDADELGARPQGRGLIDDEELDASRCTSS